MQLGVDLGGTKIEAVVLDVQGEVVWRERVPTPQGDYEATLTTIAQLVAEGKSTTGINPSCAIGMGTPGAETKRGVMKNCNSTALNGRFLRSDLSSLLQCPVHIANDANCFALAETLIGQGRRVGEQSDENAGENSVPETVFGVILGTGVGGGIVVNGKLLQGINTIAGEWGHNPLPYLAGGTLSDPISPRACYCGRTNCIETFLSGPGLAMSYHEQFGDGFSPQQIIENMRCGKGEVRRRAEGIWQQYTQQLAVSLAQVVNVLDPSLIVIGGGLSAITEIYQDIKPLMVPYVFSDTFDTPILPALLGDSAGVFGAAWLASS